MRLHLLIITSCGLTALALATGLLRPGLTPAALQGHAQRSIAGCMHHAGFNLDPGRAITLAEPALSPRDRALERCVSDTSRDPQFKRLELPDPIANKQRWRAVNFETWRCAERSGYVRTTASRSAGRTAIRCSSPPANFRVGPTERDLERFYRVAAKCSGESSTTIAGRTGRFSRNPPTAGSASPPRGTDHHSHGCYSVATYPDPAEESNDMTNAAADWVVLAGACALLLLPGDSAYAHDRGST